MLIITAFLILGDEMARSKNKHKKAYSARVNR